MIVEAELVCKCGNVAHPLYGERCEDCYIGDGPHPTPSCGRNHWDRAITAQRTDRRRSGIKRKEQ